MKFLMQKGRRAAARIERWRPDAEQLRASNPDLYARILGQSNWSEAELGAGARTSFSVSSSATAHDPDAFVALFLAEAKRVGVISSRIDQREIAAVCAAREEDAARQRNMRQSVAELSRRLAALGPNASDDERQRVMESYVHGVWNPAHLRDVLHQSYRFGPGALVRTGNGSAQLYERPDSSGEPVATLNSETAVVTRVEPGWVELQVPGGSVGWVDAAAIELAEPGSPPR
jgi:hypothetical protein